jgi:RNA polymerase sigma factor (sigma-70 family)
VSDERLILQARAGDDAAWEALVRTHQEPIFRLVYLLLGDADEAADVAQETFIRAHRALDSFDVSRPLRPWLLRIAANQARNGRRSLRRSLAALQRAFAFAPTSTSLDESAGWEGQTLWAAVRRLSHTDQEIIYLRYFLDYGEADAARALAVPQGTVKSRTSRALARLRAVIDREFPSLRAEREL